MTSKTASNPEPIYTKSSQTFLDVKNKTINWCKQLMDNGVMTPDEYNTCLGNFETPAFANQLLTSNTTGIPDNKNINVSHIYGIYDRDTVGDTGNELAGNLSTIDGSTKYLIVVPDTGQCIACDSNTGKLYMVSSILDTSVNQAETQWTIMPTEIESRYSIMGANNKFLIIDVDMSISVTSDTIGPYALWNTVVSTDKTYIESAEFPNNWLTYDTIQNLPIITNSKSETNSKWLLQKITSTDNDTSIIDKLINGYDVNNLNNMRMLNITNFKKLFINFARENYKILVLTDLRNKIEQNYNNIITNIMDYINTQVTIYKNASNNYLASNIDFSNESTPTPTPTSTQQLTNLENSSDTVTTNELPEPLPSFGGISINESSILSVKNEIINTRDTHINQISKDIENCNTNILNIKAQILKLADEHDNLRATIQQQLLQLSDKIGNNDVILNRQIDEINRIDDTLLSNTIKKENADKLNVIATQNNEIANIHISGYKMYNNFIYPISILILFIIGVYYAQSAYKKYKNNF